MAQWEDVTNGFSEKERHYKDTYLEIDEVCGEELEVSLFSAKDRDYEIYFSFGERFYGIVYAKPEEAWQIREQMKKELEEECKRSKEPSDEFIDYFAEKFHVEMPMDTVFDFNLVDYLEKTEKIMNSEVFPIFCDWDEDEDWDDDEDEEDEDEQS